MALRIRADGRILCAAMHEEQRGDTYLDDGVHYALSAVAKVLATEPMPQHAEHGRWWWVGNIPRDVTVDPFYLEPPTPDPRDTEIAQLKRELEAVRALVDSRPDISAEDAATWRDDVRDREEQSEAWQRIMIALRAHAKKVL